MTDAKPPVTKHVPDRDGVDHINVYSKARSPLGQQLSNFARTPFKHPVHGNFSSIEAFWYWCKTGCKHDALRRLFGFSAKSAGLKYDVVEMDPVEFEELIKEAVHLKIQQNVSLKRALRDSTLPLAHYYVYGRNDEIVREVEGQDWFLETLESIRKSLKEE